MQKWKHKILRKLSFLLAEAQKPTPFLAGKELEKFNTTYFTNLNPQYQKFSIGDFTYGFPEVLDMSDYDDISNQPTKLVIGKYCSIGPWVKIVLGSEHRPDWISTYPFNALSNDFRWIKGHPHSKGDIIIGNDVWVGANVTILSGVKIGDGAVIGANSLVIKDIMPYTIAAGSPAKEIKKRFDQEKTDLLLDLKWWNRSAEEVNLIIPLLQSSNFEALKKLKTGV